MDVETLKNSFGVSFHSSGLNTIALKLTYFDQPEPGLRQAAVSGIQTRQPGLQQVLLQGLEQALGLIECENPEVGVIEVVTAHTRPHHTAQQHRVSAGIERKHRGAAGGFEP